MFNGRVTPFSLFRRAVAAAAAGALVIGATLLSAASAGVNTPHSGWYSGNPLLGPNTISDLACAGTTCYGSGTFGTLLKSTDGGATWRGIVTGITADLTRVRLIGGSAERIVTGGGCSVRRSDDGGESFSRLPFTASDRSCPAGVAALAFPSASVGYLVLSNASVLSTADGGGTFSRKTAVPGGQVTDILCTSDTTCFATAGGSIQRTTDGAGSWTQLASGSPPLNGLELADPTTLYAVGNALTVLKSADGGVTWAKKDVAGTPAGDLTSIRCASAAACAISTRRGNQILRTTDGGDTFASVVPSSDATFAVEFVPPTRAIAAGALGSAEISTDAGATWRAVGRRVAGTFSVLHAVSQSVAYAGGEDGVLARTIDGGQSWTNVSAPTAANVVQIAAASAQRVFVLARGGTLQRSDNGGVSYKLLNTGTTTAPRAIVSLRDNLVLLVGPRGIRRSTDGGERFSPVQDRIARRASLTAVDRAGTAVFAYGPHRLIVSTNGGASWRRVPLPKKRAVDEVAFVSSSVGYLLDTGSRVWRTTNRGRKWTEIDSLGSNGPYALDFSDARHGYVAVAGFGSVSRERGVVLRTSDGGRSWHPQLVSPGGIQQLSTTSSTDYVLAGESSLYATTTGGDVGSPQRLALSTKSRTLKKPTRIILNGRLSPADGGEEVVVAMRSGVTWSVQIATVASNGTFVTRWRVAGTARFVAQILGDADHAGAGTRPLTVKVRKRVTKRR
jgi:photosystem II stability/assembly factor-like uncharacterized protein